MNFSVRTVLDSLRVLSYSSIASLALRTEPYLPAKTLGIVPLATSMRNSAEPSLAGLMVRTDLILSKVHLQD